MILEINWSGILIQKSNDLSILLFIDLLRESKE